MDKELKDIIDRLLKFQERDWEQFHRPKELAISIVLEAAELLEEFQWKTDKEIKKYLRKAGLRMLRKLLILQSTSFFYPMTLK